MDTITTTITSYHFDTSDPEQAATYKALADALRVTHGKCFETWGGGSGHYNNAWKDGVPVELETKHLFNNQWNGVIGGEGVRVFDWAQDYPINFSKKIKRGHYLAMTPAMQAARENRQACGYCGKQYDNPAQFCTACLDSEFLKEKELHLLRLRPVASNGKRDALTPKERALILPAYNAAQQTRRDRVAEALRESLAADLQKTIDNKTRETDGKLWLLDHGIDIDNVIYYDHLGRFCFGWRCGLTDDERATLQENLAGFPYLYDFK